MALPSGLDLGTIPDASDADFASGLGPLPPRELIFGASPAMNQVRQMLEHIGATQVAVLITGESGTGKEVVARLLHLQSACAHNALVKVTCPAIPGTLLESELFGYDKGAFTGAHASKPGRIEQAEGGTLFLDEIGELELGLQGKLLQLLQDGRFMRLGGRKEIHARARMLFATNRQLDEEVAAGRFRRDLYYRINVVGIELPPLRERREDLAALARYFILEFSRRFRRHPVPITPELLTAMQQHTWPGNVRELENMMKRYVVLGNIHELLQQLARPALVAAPKPAAAAPASEETKAEENWSLKAATREAVHQVERDIILKALAAHRWNRKRTAKALCISYRGLLYKLKEAGLQTAARTTPEEEL
ncbi:MAG TPA: sigma-54 dependent transcriptional regulator [Terriglobales bacterium]|nr:sigma-54 dependent transcriptional regulator [Terriglobales bacterium]